MEDGNVVVMESFGVWGEFIVKIRPLGGWKQILIGCSIDYLDWVKIRPLGGWKLIFQILFIIIIIFIFIVKIRPLGGWKQRKVT